MAERRPRDSATTIEIADITFSPRWKKYYEWKKKWSLPLNKAVNKVSRIFRSSAFVEGFLNFSRPTMYPTKIEIVFSRCSKVTKERKRGREEKKKKRRIKRCSRYVQGGWKLAICRVIVTWLGPFLAELQGQACCTYCTRTVSKEKYWWCCCWLLPCG